MARAALLLSLLSLTAAAAPCPSRASWPTETWPSRIAEVTAQRPSAVKALDDYAFTLEGKDEERKGIRTDGLVIVHRGELVYERYGRGFTAEMPHIAWSVTKSVMSGLVGAAVSKGALSIEDSICKHLPKVPSARCGITVRNLLEMGSGLSWEEIYEDKGNQASSVLAMLYGEGQKDTVPFVTSHEPAGEPGTLWAYSTGEATLLAAVAGAALLPAFGEEYAWKVLFDPLGMKSTVLERDAQGTPLGGSYLYATLRDQARFGYFYLSDGCWEGERLLPEGWVTQSVTPNPAYRGPHRQPGEDSVNGWCWWLNTPVPEHPIPKPYPNAPDDLYLADGHWGQFIAVIPSLELVIVRSGDDRKGEISLDQLITLARALVAP